MTDKVQKILEEVERLHNLLPVMDGDNISVNYADRICTALKMYIDSLQKEPVSDELEEAANNYCLNARKGYPRVKDETDRYICSAFKAGAQWQKERFEKDYTNLCNGIATAKGLAVTMAYDKGMADAREQMMAKAIDGTLRPDDGEVWCDLKSFNFKDGDKVKLIIIK